MLPGIYQDFDDDPDLYITNFAEYVVGSAPADWTAMHVLTGWTTLVQSVAGSLSGKALRITKTASQRNALVWNKIPTVADVEILIRARSIEAWANGDGIIHSGARIAGTAGAETVYKFVFGGTNVTTLYNSFFNKTVAGASTNFSGTATAGPSANLAVNDWVWMRGQVIGTTLRRKIWHQGSAEPGVWDETLTDSAITAAGLTGITSFGANPDCEIDFFGAAVNGKTVPLLI